MKIFDKRRLVKILFYLLLLYIAIMLIWGHKIRRVHLAHRITRELASQYNTKFVCDSLSVYAGTVDFVCHPKNDPTLMFDGFCYTDGGLNYDTFPGAIIAKDDVAVLTELLDDSFQDYFVLGRPTHRGGMTVEMVISEGDYTVDDIHEKSYSPELIFYVFINRLNDYSEFDYAREYEELERAIDALAGMYSDKYGQTICVKLWLYFIDSEKMDYTREYFVDHLLVSYDFEKELLPMDEIIIQMGPENSWWVDNLRMTKDEYIAEREKMERRYE